MNKKISKFAYIEAQIILDASKQDLLAPSVNKIEKKYGLNKGTLGTGIFLPTITISLLYSLIVVPKEYWNLSQEHPVYDDLDKAWSLQNVKIINDKSNWNRPIYKFIHHLRNAIAHANFEFKNGTFEFWDQYKNNPETYRAVLNIDTIQEFLEIVGSKFANLPDEFNT